MGKSSRKKKSVLEDGSKVKPGTLLVWGYRPDIFAELLPKLS